MIFIKILQKRTGLGADCQKRIVRPRARDLSVWLEAVRRNWKISSRSPDAVRTLQTTQNDVCRQQMRAYPLVDPWRKTSMLLESELHGLSALRPFKMTLGGFHLL